MVPKMKKDHVFNVFMIFNGFDRLHNIDFDLNNVRAKRKFGGFRLFFTGVYSSNYGKLIVLFVIPNLGKVL